MDNNLNVETNLVHDNRSVKFMPMELKQTVIDRLLKHQSKHSNWEMNRDIVINFLTNHDYSYIKWKLFWHECRQRDEYRNESFEKTFPDYYKEIKKYL